MQRFHKLLALVASRLKRTALRPLAISAEDARDRGDFKEAVICFQRLIQADPGDVAARIQLGNMLKDVGRFPEARDSYDIARLMKPDDADVWLQLGHLSKLQGRLHDAIHFYRRSASIDPKRGDAQRELTALGETTSPSRSEARLAFETDAAPTRFISASGPSLVLERLKSAFDTRPE